MAAAATFCADAGAMVLQSISSAPGWMTLISPSSPRYSASTCRLAGSMEMTTSAPCTASRADAATSTPSARTFAMASALRSDACTV